jgi:hypothetical protein
MKLGKALGLENFYSNKIWGISVMRTKDDSVIPRLKAFNLN